MAIDKEKWSTTFKSGITLASLFFYPGPKNFYRLLWDAYHTIEPFYGTLSLKIDGGFIWDNHLGPFDLEWRDWDNNYQHISELLPPFRKDIQFRIDKWWSQDLDTDDQVVLRVSSHYPSQWYVGVSLSADFHFFIVCTPKV